MIARHFEMRDARKSSFSRLAKYITDARNGERLGRVRVTNCHSDPQCLDAVVSEILAVQQRNVRARSDKTRGERILSLGKILIKETPYYQKIKSCNG